ncbi:hypothetical protein KIW84_045542 [Lathyrus oleraceus]|uniref:Ubiquitin-like protease family profile domain-containing protein n=1 Tax=Pisum sativum TaxID=3888 RepID=A0A9D5AXD0_PEA|nr:hypothetical protein KIW84_045542 [Pisum sativum]
MDNKDAEKLFFIPFNTGGHWLLLAINPIREIVYYLDSLGNDWTTYPDMKVLIDTVLQAFGPNEISKPQGGAPTPLHGLKWRVLNNIPTDYFEEFKCAFYTKDQVDEIKEEWCQFMIELNVCS